MSWTARSYVITLCPSAEHFRVVTSRTILRMGMCCLVGTVDVKCHRN